MRATTTFSRRHDDPRPVPRRSGFRLAATLGEQLAYTGAFFLVQVIAARSLSVPDFALFAALYSLVILLSLVHGCTVFDTLLLRGRLAGPPHARALWRLHLPVLVVVGAVAGYGVLALGVSPGLALLFLLACASFVLYWTVRALAILAGRSAWLLIPPLAQVLLVAALARAGLADPLTLFAGIVLSLGLPALLLLGVLGRGASPDAGGGSRGRFLGLNLAAQGVFWGLTHGLVIYFFLRDEPDQAASVRICLTLLLPAQYLCIAVSNHLLPRLSELARAGRSRRFQVQARRLLMVCLALSALYAAALMLGVEEGLRLLFGAQAARLDVRALALLPIAFAVVQVGRTLLKAGDQPGRMLACMLVGLGLVLACSFLELTSAVSLLNAAVAGVALALLVASGPFLIDLGLKDGE